MIAQRNRPSPAAETAPGSPDLAAQSTVDVASRPLIGATVEARLHKVFCGLAAGTLGLHDVTPSLMGIYDMGYVAGRAARQAEVDRLDADADRLWLAAFSPERRFELLRRRMDGIDFDACSSSRHVVLTMLRAADGRTR